jgi:histidyl-tRNA synthetase
MNNSLVNNHTLKNPLGTRDLYGVDLYIRDKIQQITTDCFEKYGGVKLDTPILECLTSITALYGDEFDKLVYKLNDGGEQLFLRYDLTLPLARFISMNGLKQFRRYQIGKVYRKDNPQISKGRYREFYQCDFDIIGDDQGTCLFQYEIIDLFDHVLFKLLENNFKIKINDRRFLIELLLYFGIRDDKINDVSCVLDKLDKKTIDELKLELKQKHIPDNIIRNIFNTYDDINKCITSDDKIKYFKNKEICTINFVSNIVEMNISERIIFDPFMVRGMEYYTGLIFEAEYIDKDLMPSSIGGGGTYNKMISSINNNSEPIHATGMSIGVERIATILEKSDIYKPRLLFDIYVATIGKNMEIARFKLVSELRKLNFRVTMSHLANPKMRPQFDAVFELKIPIMIILGSSELITETIKIKEILKSTEVTCKRSDLADFLHNFFKDFVY